MKMVPITEIVDIKDNLRKPINNSERQKRIRGKSTDELYPYYGATGQVGYIDDYLIDGEFVLLGEDAAPFLDFGKEKAYMIKGKCWVNNHAHILQAKEGLSLNNYILHYLNFFNYSGYVNGTTRLKLTKGSLEQIPVPIFPLSVQKKIVSKIDVIFNELNEATTELDSTLLKLEHYKRSILLSAIKGTIIDDPFQNKAASTLFEEIEKTKKNSTFKNLKTKNDLLPPPQTFQWEIPNNWLFVQLGELKSYSIYGPRFSSDDYSNSGVNVLRTTDIDEYGRVNVETAPKLKLTDEEYEKYKVEKGDLLITRTGSIGTLAIFNDNVRAIPGAYLLHYKFFRNDLISPWVELVLKSEYGQMLLKGGGAGVGRPNINAPTIDSIVIPIPPDHMIMPILNKVKDYLEVIEEFEKDLKKKKNDFIIIKNAILKVAFEGRLV